MPRFKDLPKTHLGITDGYMLEQSLKGSLTPIQAEPAIMERVPEVRVETRSQALEEIQWELKEIKKDIQSLKEFVETMDKNGLKMKRQW
jgi:hypothetical protein